MTLRRREDGGDGLSVAPFVPCPGPVSDVRRGDVRGDGPDDAPFVPHQAIRAAERAGVAAAKTLSAYPPLVLAPECDRLRNRLAAASRGEAFLVYAAQRTHPGDAVPTEDVTTILQISALLSYATSLPVIPVGTIPTHPADPVDLHRAYQTSASVLNQIRAHLASRDVGMREIHARTHAHVTAAPSTVAGHARRRALVDEIDKALRFLEALGAPTDTASPAFFTAHEARLLDFEEALIRPHSTTGEPYAASRHLVSLAAHDARHLDGPHVAFAARVRNPVAVTLGPDTRPDDVSALIDRLDPAREPGRLTLVTALGPDRIRDLLPGLIRRAADAQAPVVWVCDTAAAPLDELAAFVGVHRELGTHAGGIRVDLTFSRGLDLAFSFAESWLRT